MKKILNFIKTHPEPFVAVFVTTAIVIISISVYKEMLAQKLCKNAEYDFCHVKTYEIVIK